MAVGIADEQAARRANASPARRGHAGPDEPVCRCDAGVVRTTGGAGGPAARLTVASTGDRRLDLGGVALRLDLLEDVRDAPVSPDEERRPVDSHVRLAVIL